MAKPKHPTQEELNARYWRYKKRSVPVDDFAHKNGPVITRIPKTEPVVSSRPKVLTSLPHPFKCSRCAYVGLNKRDVNSHYDDEHYRE